VQQFVHRELAAVGRWVGASACTIRLYAAATDASAVADLASSIADAPAAGGSAAWQAVGLVTLVESRGRGGDARWSIGWLLVRPESRGQGVGRALVAAAVGHARESGAEAIWAETSTDWPAAAFWQALGFEPARPGA
jgi:GNAT superfamily N-acetyltransferase